ncbi:MAG: helicase associated domain-containing protein [Nitrospiraceae bacterium]
MPRAPTISEDGYRLGSWVSAQRQKVETLSPERHQRLNALGFVWKVR